MVRAEARDRRGGRLEGAVAAAEVVVMLRRERIDTDGKAGDTGALERFNTTIIEERPVCSDHHRGTVVLRVLGDALEIGTQQRLAAGEDEQRRGIEREDLAGDAEALRRRQLTRRRLVWPRRDVAVGALEIAAAREIPRDHMWHVFARRLELRRLGPSEVYRGCPRGLLHVIPRERSDRGICLSRV